MPESLQERAVRPHYIASNQFGDIYILDDENYWLALIPGDGSETRIAGGWGDHDDLFSAPTDVVASPGLDVFVCDNATHRILRFDRKLNFVTDMQLSELSSGSVEYPFRIARNWLGEILVTSSLTWELSLLSGKGRTVTTVGDATYGGDRFSRIEDVAVGKENEVGVVDGGANTFILISREGRFVRRVALPEGRFVALNRWDDAWLAMTAHGGLHLLSDSENRFKKVSGKIHLGEEIIIADCTTVEDVVYAVDSVSGIILRARLEHSE